MTPQERLNRILEVINEGKTVVFTTYGRSTQVDKKDLAKFEKRGVPLFKASSKSLYMARGKKYECIDGCQITVWSYEG